MQLGVVGDHLHDSVSGSRRVWTSDPRANFFLSQLLSSESCLTAAIGGNEHLYYLGACASVTMVASAGWLATVQVKS